MFEIFESSNLPSTALNFPHLAKGGKGGGQEEAIAMTLRPEPDPSSSNLRPCCILPTLRRGGRGGQGEAMTLRPEPDPSCSKSSNLRTPAPPTNSPARPLKLP